MKDKEMLEQAIKDTDILAPKQKEVLRIICDSEFPVSATVIEELMGVTRQAVYLTLKTLCDREFIKRERERVFLYKPNNLKILELIERYKHKLALKIK